MEHSDKLRCFSVNRRPVITVGLTEEFKNPFKVIINRPLPHTSARNRTIEILKKGFFTEI